MSREIGFRVWSKKHNTYFELSGLHYEGDKIDGIFAISGTLAGIPNVIFLEPEDVVLEQDTGLKDKNGKRICEGDIVELDWYIYGDKPAYRVQSEVIFDEEGARVRNGEHSDLLKYCTGVEVIGNIHGSPELLGGENE